jgi:hypothetical protein
VRFRIRPAKFPCHQAAYHRRSGYGVAPGVELHSQPPRKNIFNRDSHLEPDRIDHLSLARCPVRDDRQRQIRVLTDMQHHGTLKDTQGILRHASIRTTGDIYVQAIDASVQQAVNSRTAAVLDGFVAPVADMGLGGRNLKRPEAIRRSSAKLLEEVSVSY